MNEPFREELRRALAADAAAAEHGLEDRILSRFREGIEHRPGRWGIHRGRPRDLQNVGPPAAWVLVAFVLAIAVVAALIFVGPLARSRAVPAHPAPTSVTPATPADPAVANYRALVETGFAPLQRAGDLSANRCPIAPSPSCRMATVEARQSAQTFLDTLTASSAPPGLEEAHGELVGGLRELIPAYDAQLAAIDSGDAAATSTLAITSVGIKGQKVYHGIADTKCWPRRAVRGSDNQLSWVCPSS
jgi:hypothetical protein